jgi:hypothetical protein
MGFIYDLGGNKMYNSSTKEGREKQNTVAKDLLVSIISLEDRL